MAPRRCPLAVLLVSLLTLSPPHTTTAALDTHTPRTLFPATRHTHTTRTTSTPPIPTAIHSTSFGGPSLDEGHSIAVDSLGSTYVTGTLRSSKVMMGPTLNISSQGNQDVFVAKYDATGALVWAEAIGGKVYEEGNGIAIDESRNAVYVVGYFWTTPMTVGDFTLSSLGEADVLIARLEASTGKIVWVRGYGGERSDHGTGVAVDAASGYVYAIGGFGSKAITLGKDILSNQGSPGQDDVWVARFDPENGYVVWAEGIGGTSLDYAAGIAMGPDGTVYVTGYSWSSGFSLGTYTIANQGRQDIFVAKFTSNGDVRWAKGFGAQLDESSADIAVDAEGQAYVTGTFTSKTVSFATDAVVENRKSPYQDIFAVKIDGDDGTALWATSLGGIVHDSGKAIAVDPKGEVVYVAGTFTSQNFTVTGYDGWLDTQGGYDVVLAGLRASNGDGLWLQGMGGTSHDFVGDIAVGASSGDLHITGWYQSKALNLGVAGTALSNTAGGQPVFVVAEDVSGLMPSADAPDDVTTPSGSGGKTSTGKTPTTGSTQDPTDPQQPPSDNPDIPSSAASGTACTGALCPPWIYLIAGGGAAAIGVVGMIAVYAWKNVCRKKDELKPMTKLEAQYQAKGFDVI